MSRVLRVFHTGANPIGHELVMDDWFHICQLNNEKNTRMWNRFWQIWANFRYKIYTLMGIFWAHFTVS